MNSPVDHPPLVALLAVGQRKRNGQIKANYASNIRRNFKLNALHKLTHPDAGSEVKLGQALGL